MNMIGRCSLTDNKPLNNSSPHHHGYRPLHLMTLDDKQFYEENGYVHIANVFNKSEMNDICNWISDISSWKDSEAKWWHHYENTAEGIKKSRTENFLGYHPNISQLIMTGRIPKLVGDALDHDVFIYKEKINYKYPGGGGYLTHQDAPAYKQINNHCTCLLSIDQSTVENGCLEFVPGLHKQGLIGTNDHGIIHNKYLENMHFEPCETEPGDVVIFSSYTPHRSLKNTTKVPRRLIYLTYNIQEEGYLREEYYRHKREHLDKNQISLIKHFDGDTTLYPDSLCTKKECMTFIENILKSKGHTSYDSNVTQLEHGLQTAQLALQQENKNLVVASLLHDLGHLMLDEHANNDSFLQKNLSHESIAADFLERFYPPAITVPIRLHVPAKRYLCSIDKEYYHSLSTSSKRSLEVQGGPFTDSEAKQFINQEYAPDAVLLRRYDDNAKKQNVKTHQLSYFLPFCEKLMST